MSGINAQNTLLLHIWMIKNGSWARNYVFSFRRQMQKGMVLVLQLK